MWPRGFNSVDALPIVFLSCAAVPCHVRVVLLIMVILFVWGACRGFKVNVELELQGASTNLIQVESNTKTKTIKKKEQTKHNDQQIDSVAPRQWGNKNN